MFYHTVCIDVSSPQYGFPYVVYTPHYNQVISQDFKALTDNTFYSWNDGNRNTNLLPPQGGYVSLTVILLQQLGERRRRKSCCCGSAQLSAAQHSTELANEHHIAQQSSVNTAVHKQLLVGGHKRIWLTRIQELSIINSMPYKYLAYVMTYVSVIF